VGTRMALRFAQHCQRRQVGGVQPLKLFTAKRAASTQVHNITNTEPAKVIIMDNGVRLAYEPCEGGLVSLNVFLRVGSANERHGKNGTANLLQRAAVKNAAEQARKLGGVLVGHTGRERTTYSLTCLPDRVTEAVSLLGEVVQATTSADVLEKARSEVLAGRKALWNVVNEEVVMDFIHSTAYQGTPLENTAAGEIKTIKELQTSDLEQYQNDNYVGENIVISVAGAFDSDKLGSAAKAAFSGVPRATSPKTPTPVPYTGAMMHIRDNTVHDIQVAIGYETFPITHKHAFTLGVLKHLLGKWDLQSPAGTNSSSRLAEAVARQHLVSLYRPFVNFYKDTGLFGIYAKTQNVDKLDDLVYEIFNEYQKLFSYLSPEELFRAKHSLKVELLNHQNSTASRSHYLGSSVTRVDRPVSLAESFSRIDLITQNDVQELIDSNFYDVDPVVVAHGDLEEMPDYVILRGWTYWNRW